jgi:hypothetical protein
LLTPEPSTGTFIPINSRIVDLANSLLERIQESLDLERSAEDARIEAYKKARKLLTITLNNANTVLANLQVELARYHRSRYPLALRMLSPAPRPPLRTPSSASPT